MRTIRALLVLAALFLTAGGAASAQTADPGITPNGVIGEVIAVDAGAKQVFIKTDAGSVVTVAVADNTVFKKLPPGETTLTKAADLTLGELAAGDRAFARGSVSDDRKTVMARMVVVMTRSDIARKHEADRAEWKRRGVGGVVTALNPATKEITIQPFGGRPAVAPDAAGAPPAGPPAGPPAPVVIAADLAAVKFRRYAPNSVKFSDAKGSSFDELKVGDQLRALGERSADGARFKAEEVVSGSFRTVLGTVKAVNAAAREIQITTVEGNQPMTVVVSKDSEVKQVPAEFGQAMVMRGPGGPGGGPGGESGPAPAGGNQMQRAPGAGPGPGGEGGPRRVALGIQEMLERLPAASVEEIKPGSMIVFSTTGADPAKATAIQLVAGVEPIVQMMQARAAAQNRPLNLGGFNLGIGQP
jgi:hypothetical protein